MPKVSDQYLAARRRQILDAALTEFARQGFHQTSMQAIFEKARLSPGAVYRYFKSKEEIVYAIASEALGGVAGALEPDESGRPLGPPEVLDRLFDAAEGIQLRPERNRLAVQVWGEALHNPRIGGLLRKLFDEVRTRIADQLRDAQRRGALAPTVDPEETARVLLAIAQGFVVQSSLDGEFDAEAFRAAAQELVTSAHPPTEQ